MSKICKCDERFQAIKDGKIYFEPLNAVWIITFKEGLFRCGHGLELCPYCMNRLPENYDA